MKRLLIVVSSAVMLAWCGDDRPTTPVGPTPSVPPTSAEVATALEIAGNTNLTAVGETSQLRAIATFANGSNRDVSGEVRWRSFNATVATISPTGVLTAVAPGRTGIDAQLQTKYSRRDVSVLPSGTFVLRGTVIEPGNLPIFSAQVMVVGGPDAGQSTRTNGIGEYELYGLSGALAVTVTKDEYIVQTKNVTLTEDRVLDFELQPVVAPIAIAGPYQVTFTAAANCSVRLPEQARTRSYSAVIHQAAARVDVELLNADFALNPADGRGRRFSGRLQSNRLGFSIGDTYYGYFEDIVEQLGATTYLTIRGVGFGAAAAGAPISGNLEGVIAVWDAPNGFYGFGPRTTIDCRGTHQFEFARQ